LFLFYLTPDPSPKERERKQNHERDLFKIALAFAGA